MDDYISREAAIKRMHEWIPESIKPLWKQPIEEFEKILKSPSIPAADVRPVVRGRWEKHEDFDSYGGGRFVEWVCSECDKRLRGDWATRNHIEETPAENFCPNCGADMREEK